MPSPGYSSSLQPSHFSASWLPQIHASQSSDAHRLNDPAAHLLHEKTPQMLHSCASLVR